ncbi:choline/ethanolamine kinase-like isoform X2 [Cloeon dipterum]
MSSESGEMRERAFRLCRDYLHGAWKVVAPHEIVLKRISGGLSNWLYLCKLPSNRPARNGEPSQVLLRFYGQIHGEKALEGLITESVIFTLLSERRLGPKLHGVFPGGRLEEFIPARPLHTEELKDPKISVIVAEKMAQIHSMNVPVSKEPRWLWDTMNRWMQSIQDEIKDEQNTDPHSSQLLRNILAHNLVAELKWLRKFLLKVGSPVVFCHNDLQEGNILLRDDASSPSDSLVPIDFEYCAYNYRAFDLANHFCEWVYDYSNKQSPNFFETRTNYPSTEQQLNFVRAYLATLHAESSTCRTAPSDLSVRANEEQAVLKEVHAFTLASHFFWGLWSLVNSKVSQIPFGYLEYSNARFDAYFLHKSKLLPDAKGCHQAVDVPGTHLGKRKAEEMAD